MSNIQEMGFGELSAPLTRDATAILRASREARRAADQVIAGLLDSEAKMLAEVEAFASSLEPSSYEIAVEARTDEPKLVVAVGHSFTVSGCTPAPFAVTVMRTTGEERHHVEFDWNDDWMGLRAAPARGDGESVMGLKRLIRERVEAHARHCVEASSDRLLREVDAMHETSELKEAVREAVREVMLKRLPDQVRMFVPHIAEEELVGLVLNLYAEHVLES